jgi:hypothetical protein
MKTKLEIAMNEFDREMKESFSRYTKLHDSLDEHRGKEIGDTNLHEVNRIIGAIQEEFSVLYPALYFIASRYEFANNATNSYNEFMETLIKAGATEETGN